MSVKNKKRKRKRKRASYYTLFYILFGFFGIIVLAILSLTILFPIKSINVKGNSIYTNKQIIEAGGIEIGSNIISTDFKKVNDLITKRLPYIDKVEVKRNFDLTVTLNVTAAKPFAQFEQADGYYLINSSGKCIELLQKKYQGIPIIRQAKVDETQPGEIINIKDSEQFDALMMLNGYLKDYQLIKDITVINLSDLQDIWVTYKDRIVLLFGSIGHLDEKMGFAVLTLQNRESDHKTGTLNLSRIPNTKNQASFISCELSNEQISYD